MFPTMPSVAIGKYDVTIEQYTAFLNAVAVTDTYWLYPTQSNTVPGNTISAGANQANFNNGVYSVTQSETYITGQVYLTDVGTFSGSGSGMVGLEASESCPLIQ